jgi:hypothetical protein
VKCFSPRCVTTWCSMRWAARHYEGKRVYSHEVLAMLHRLLVRSFFHCGKSMIRSGMWEPDRWASTDGLPSYAQAMKDAGELTNFKDSLESLQSLGLR